MRAQLHRLCADRPDLDVIAEATNGVQAIDVIQGSDADLLLLDARLPDMSGFELLRSLVPEEAPATIMVTSTRDEAEPATRRHQRQVSLQASRSAAVQCRRGQRHCRSRD